MGHGLTGFNCFAQPYGELAMWLRIKLIFTQGEIVSPGNHAPSRGNWPDDRMRHARRVGFNAQR